MVRFLQAGTAFGDLPPVETPPRPIIPEPLGIRTDPAAATTTSHPVLGGASTWWRGHRFGVRKVSLIPVLFGGRGQSAALGQSPPCYTGPRATTLLFSLFFFLIEGRHVPACLPLLFLLHSGDIETNPGPYKCPTCNRPWTRRTRGIQCGGCDSWTHYNIRCSGVRQHAHIPQGWRCLRCHPSHNTALPPLSSPSTPPLPVPSPLSPTLPPAPPCPTSPPTPSLTAPAPRLPPRGGLRGAGVSPPALTPSRPQNNTLNILQINTNGIRNKIMELRALLHEQHIHIATIQESKLTTTSNTPSFPGYTTLRHDRPTRGGGGLLTLIHKDIPFTNTTAETHARMRELQSTRIQIHKHHYNIYIPPQTLHRQDIHLP